MCLEETCTQEIMPYDYGSRDWGDVSRSPESPETERKAWTRLSPRAFRESMDPAQQLDFGLIVSRNVRIDFCCLSHAVCGTLSQQP